MKPNSKKRSRPGEHVSKSAPQARLGSTDDAATRTDHLGSDVGMGPEVNLLIANARSEATRRRQSSRTRHAIERTEYQTRVQLKHTAEYVAGSPDGAVHERSESVGLMLERERKGVLTPAVNREFCSHAIKHALLAAKLVRSYLAPGAPRDPAPESTDQRHSITTVARWRAPKSHQMVSYENVEPRDAAAAVAKAWFKELLAADDLESIADRAQSQLVAIRAELGVARFGLGAWFEQLAVAVVVDSGRREPSSASVSTRKRRRPGARKGRPAVEPELDSLVKAALRERSPSKNLAGELAESLGRSEDEIRKSLERVRLALDRASKPRATK